MDTNAIDRIEEMPNLGRGRKKDDGFWKKFLEAFRCCWLVSVVVRRASREHPSAGRYVECVTQLFCFPATASRDSRRLRATSAHLFFVAYKEQ
jgi:hypothetical protein